MKANHPAAWKSLGLVAIVVAFAASFVVASGWGLPGRGDVAQASDASMGLAVFRDTGKTDQLCGPGPLKRNCGDILIGQSFSVNVLATTIPPEGYTRFQAVIEYPDGLVNLQQETGFDEVVWPDEGCDQIGFGDETKDTGRYIVTCKRSGNSNSFHNGPLANLQFTCKEKGVAQISIVGGEDFTTPIETSYYFRPSIGPDFVFLKSDPADSVLVNCANPTPTPTPTPTSPPPTDTPTATPANTPTPSPTPKTGQGPKMSIDVYGDSGKTELACGPGQPLRNCGTFTANDTFSVDVNAKEVPPDGYTQFQVVLHYTAGLVNVVQQAGFDEVVWPDEGCDAIGGGEETKETDQYIVRCKRSGTENSDFLGTLVNVHFQCKQTGTVTIEVAGGTSTQKSSYFFRPSIFGNIVFLKENDAIQVNCIGPTPTKQPEPGDTDLDGCSDQAENGTDPTTGGQRNYFYFWDFYDVWTDDGGGGWQRDGAVTLDDILATAARFGEGAQHDKIAAFLLALNPPTDASSYHPAFDRSGNVGPDPWDKGPPDGTITLDDILSVAEQFGHDCT